jgi:signal transduction histidine kinase
MMRHPARALEETMVLRRIFIVFLLCLGLPAGAQGAAPADSAVPSRVVLIRSWDSLFASNIIRERALREKIAQDAPREVEFYPEEIDPLRFAGAIEGDFVSLLERKYRDTKVDVVVASGIDALEFAASHRDSIWPQATIIFSGVFDGALDNWRRPPRTAGITMALDIEGTLALGRALVPALKNVYVVAGTSSVDYAHLELATAKLSRVEPPLQVHYLSGLTREEASARVASLGPDSLVLYLTMLRDGTGRLSGPGAPALKQVVSHSSAPVVSPFQTQLGFGVVGVVAPRHEVHGRVAGELVLAVLGGTNADSLPIRATPEATCEVDWRALGRWQLAERNVPRSCLIANPPPNLLRTHLAETLAAIAIIALQAALLSALVVQSRRRRVAEARLQARTHELAHESRLSMMGALTANLAHEINQPIGAILSNTEAAQMMLEQGTLAPDKLREILADIRGDDLRASEVIQTLRKLFGRGQWRPMTLEVNAEVAEALRFIEFEAERRAVKLTPQYGSEMPAVMGDPVQLQQVVINLAVNAIEEVADLPGTRREIRIDTHARAGGVEIAVVDEGAGLTPENAARLFETPFTTKKESMGFGLSIVRSIVEMHRGRVWFEPNLPRGAIFRVWLPAVFT